MESEEKKKLKEEQIIDSEDSDELAGLRKWSLTKLKALCLKACLEINGLKPDAAESVVFAKVIPDFVESPECEKIFSAVLVITNATYEAFEHSARKFGQILASLPGVMQLSWNLVQLLPIIQDQMNFPEDLKDAVGKLIAAFNILGVTDIDKAVWVNLRNLLWTYIKMFWDVLLDFDYDLEYPVPPWELREEVLKMCDNFESKYPADWKDKQAQHDQEFKQIVDELSTGKNAPFFLAARDLVQVQTSAPDFAETVARFANINVQPPRHRGPDGVGEVGEAERHIQELQGAFNAINALQAHSGQPGQYRPEQIFIVAGGPLPVNAGAITIEVHEENDDYFSGPNSRPCDGCGFRIEEINEKDSGKDESGPGGERSTPPSNGGLPEQQPIPSEPTKQDISGDTEPVETQPQKKFVRFLDH